MSLQSSGILQRLDGYRRWIAHQHGMWRYRRDAARCLRYYERWMNRISAKPPEVFLGPDLAYGGVRGHVRNIRKYSSLRVQLVPDEEALGGLHNFSPEAHQRFMDFVPDGTPVVHSHVIPWMIRWCRKQQEHGSLWVHTYHLPYFPEHGSAGLEPDQIEINEALIHEACHADIRLSVSRWQQDYLLAEHGIETDYLPNGVDVAACDQGDAERFTRWSKIKGPFILHVSRRDTVKNPAEFVRLAALRPDLRFVVIGQGLDEQVMGSEWQTPTPENLHYLGGRTHNEVQDAVAACAALVVTSKREGLPTLVLEAMAQGKPVVVPDEAGCVEAVDHGRYGFIYPLGDLGSLNNALSDALADHTLCTTARQRILDHYDWRAVARQLDRFYSIHNH